MTKTKTAVVLGGYDDVFYASLLANTGSLAAIQVVIFIVIIQADRPGVQGKMNHSKLLHFLPPYLVGRWRRAE